MNKTILTPKEAEKLQNKIYQKMSLKKKIKIASQLFILGKKIKESQIITKSNKNKS